MGWRGRRQQLKGWLQRAAPRPDTWSAIGRTWRWTAAVLILVTFLVLGWPTGGVQGWLGVAAILGLVLLACVGAWLAIAMLSRLQPGVRLGLLLLVAPVIPLGVYSPLDFVALYLFLLLTTGCIVAGALRFLRGQAVSGAVLLLLGALSLLAGVILLLLPGWQAEPSRSWPPISADPGPLPNPGLPGTHRVLTFSYGSGEDRHREAFGPDVDWRSTSVDGSKLIDGWDGPAGWARTGYWGFDAAALPVQGRVWAPDGPGPFPLVLIVHGNHEGPDFSDVGYGYLGKLFASRGIIAVSVDENFLNSFQGDFLSGPDGGLEEESDARAWLLLQHLVQWREWSADPAHIMHGRADLDRVVLIGHSRGGEAVSEAALFNRLPRYPDDGTLAFDFDFGILGIIAIAPVDHQYHPRDRDTPLADINLLVIHGSHDADVDAFAGSAMFSRLRFDACGDCFKTSFYLVGANHGQFNTSWGRHDSPFPPAAMLNLVPLMEGEAQREVAAVMFGAFLEATLNDRQEYQAVLARPELGAHWFPEGAAYLTNYGDARLIVLADYEEDADLTTGGIEVAAVAAVDLGIWKEAEVALRWRDMDSAAVLLGWGSDETAEPAYEIRLLDGGLAVAPNMALSFAAAMATQAPEGVEDYEVPESLSFDVELVDSAGISARVPLAARRPLYPQVDPVLYKLEAFDDEPASEPVFQRYVFAFREWQAVNPELDLNAIQTVRFLFPTEIPASLWLDDIAISPEGV